MLNVSERNHTERSLDEMPGGEPNIIAASPAMLEVLAMARRAAVGESKVLVTGESGVGKDLIARAIHFHSPRRDRPFVKINCTALPENLMESELFGYEKGAFAGAEARKVGLFELAGGGTLFMDEIGGLDPKVQGKLLRALEQGSFFRVGGTQKVEVNARIVTATNKDLAVAVSEGRFRSDLFYRINTISIVLPPLRERAVDIPLLANAFLAQFGGAHPPQLSDEAMRALQDYRWPGNVRELRNVMERAVLLANGGVIQARDLPLHDTHAPARGGTNGDVVSLAEVERRHIESVLSRTNWHQGRAATVLGISSKTLYRKIREYGFHRPRAANG